MLRSGGAPRQKPSSYKKETTKKVYKKAAVKNGSSGNLRKPRKKPDWDVSNFKMATVLEACFNELFAV